MTLSHCWGTLKCLTLTSVNYKYLEAGFKLIELPKTFREAVEITRNLGIRYLWIDALCILQDSHKDWRHEAATMMKVYENSHCNISALRATDSEEGCFSERFPGLQSRIIVETDWMNEFNPFYDIYPEKFWRYHVEFTTLNRRAWVFQERLLAPRILHYGSDQLLWECLELDACETYPDGLPCTDTVARNNLDDGGAISRRWKGVDLDPEALRRRFALEPSKRSMMYKYWRQLVHFYSWCHLTRAEDKLVAISGLAKRVQSCLDDEYLAGLWKASLPSGLLWCAGRRPGCPKRSSSYCAPTWSWASMEGGVCFEEEFGPCVEPLEDLDFRCTLTSTSEISQAPRQVSPGPCRHHPESLEPFIHPVTILATGVDLATTDLTGQVTHGFIHLTGSLIPARIEIDPSRVESESPAESERYTVHLQMLPHNGNYLYPDIDLERVCGQAGIFFLPVMINWAAGLYAPVQGLLLELVDPVNQMYKRIGLLKIYQDVHHYDTEEEDSLFHASKEEFKGRVLTLI